MLPVADRLPSPSSHHEIWTTVETVIDKDRLLGTRYGMGRSRHLQALLHTTWAILPISSLGEIATLKTPSPRATSRLVYTRRHRHHILLRFDDGARTGSPPVASPTTQGRESAASPACACYTRVRNHWWTSSSSTASEAAVSRHGAREPTHATFGPSVGCLWRRDSRMQTYTPLGMIRTGGQRSRAC